MLEDGRRLRIRSVIADRVRGVDADGDLLIPLAEPGQHIPDDHGDEYLVPLTPCCHAHGKGADSATGVVCRNCYREVDPKYGGPGDLSVAVAGARPALQFFRRRLAPRAASRAPWITTEAAVRTLREPTPPSADVSTEDWRSRMTATLALLESAADVRLSPAGHFLAIRSRVHRNRPYRWYVVHVATGAYPIRLGDYRPEDSADPHGAEMDLSEEAVLGYLDAIERLPGRRGGLVDWGVAPVDLQAEISRWEDPLIQRDEHDPEHAYRRLPDAVRALHRTAVLHALAADPARDATTETVQKVLISLLEEPLPPMYDRDPAPVADYLRRLLLDFNGGRRRDRSDRRTPEARRSDARTAQVTILAALTTLGAHPRSAVDALRARAAHLRQGQGVHARAEQLERGALLIAELASPVPTERQLLRHVVPGDVIAFLHPNFLRPLDALYVKQVVQVSGPVSYLGLGLANGAEEFIVPVIDLTYQHPTPAVLMVLPDKSLRLHALEERPSVHTLWNAAAAVDHWAVLPADAVRLKHDALAERIRVASRRAAEAFDPPVTTTSTPPPPPA
ncbi:hypothetical protein [Nocardia sp. NRRL S-836]|uniref:hypothetical protein n=1 Tax=Nocardia sp. NRRL S-836 TaxID=1519492 RepID=UPI0006ADB62A|nr:hypothetical protein [Nocardia sp. NRRL S-836]